MKWTDLIRLSFTNLWRRKTRTILTMIGTMIGTASIVVMVSLGIGINQGYIDSMAATGELTNITVNSQTYYGGGGMVSDIGTGNSVKAVKLDDALVRKLSQLDHVTVVSPQLDLYNLTLGTGKLQSYYSLTAINPDAVEALGLKVSQFVALMGDQTPELSSIQDAQKAAKAHIEAMLKQYEKNE